MKSPLKPILLFIASFIIISWACTPEPPANDEPAGSGGWLTGDAHEKFDRLANQFGGFSQAMWEIGYRYNEMYFAAKDENWEFAGYHLEHIEEAMEAGFERRPGREASARRFMEEVIPEMHTIFDEGDPEKFRNHMMIMKQECNTCHEMEDVPFIRITIPEHRLSPAIFEDTRERERLRLRYREGL